MADTATTVDYPFDADRVQSWLTDITGTLAGPLQFRRIGSGRSNLTYLAQDAAGNKAVLRRPPLGEVEITSSVHDVAREGRILKSLADSPVPVPRIFGLSTDPALCPAPLLAMEFIPGHAIDSIAAAESMSVHARIVATEGLIDALVGLHSIDVDEVGLRSISIPGSFAQRQLARWGSQWERIRTRESKTMAELTERLRSALPQETEERLVHGEWSLGNLMFDPTSGELNAVLDWELATVGDPLADVGRLLAAWPERDFVLPGSEAATVEGFPTATELARRYLTKTGRSAEDLKFWQLLGMWRLVIIAEGVLNHVQHSGIAAPVGAVSEQDVDLLIDRALAFADRADL
ncbi:phosphotransferase family protein [Corynebacterium ulceribovis]|uniref:phosphotransferase family protein n=1 Tax=Corynebacterium ulceribovis TaxID=487732 RepID=UPI0003A6EB62|nr:phosphotransferase family protein [Corynebacterium ulceribovis]